MTLLTGVGDSSRFALRHGNWVTAITGDGDPGHRPAVLQVRVTARSASRRPPSATNTDGTTRRRSGLVLTGFPMSRAS
jgi:hypothetical protein